MQRILEPEVMDRPDRAEAYANADFDDVNEAFVDRLRALAGAMPPTRIVDLGPGPCDIPFRMASTFPSATILAFDASPVMLRLARQDARYANVRASVALVQTDAKRCPAATHSIDAVVSNSILHHLPDPAPFWKEVARIACPGAMVLIRDLMRPATRDEAEALVAAHAGSESALLRDEFFNSLLAAFTVDEVRNQLEAAGLHTLHVEAISDRHFDVAGRLPR